MKLIAGLLALFVLYMSVQPEIDAILSLANTECCSSDHCSAIAEQRASEEDQDDNCCGNGWCNPFLTCCAGMGIALNFTTLEILVFESSVEKIGGYESAVQSQFAPDFWQPPKIG